MAGTPKIRIQKNAYNFDIKKRYQNVEHYKTIVRPPIEKIKESLRGMFEKKEQKKPGYYKPKAAEEKPGFNMPLMVGAVGLGVLLIFLVWIYLSIQAFQTAPSRVVPVLDRPVISNLLYDGDVVTAGDKYSGTYVGRVFTNYSVENADNYSVAILSYEKQLPSQVFVLRSDREDAASYIDFMHSLRAILAEKHIMVNEITIDELGQMPEGGVVLVPSGFLPKELLGGGANPKLTPNMLADRGNVIIYIGRPFTKVLDNGITVVIPQQLKQNNPFTFDEQNQPTAAGISLYQPLYTLSANGWSVTTAYGAVSIAIRGNGAFVFVPQTLGGGWKVDPLKQDIPAYSYAAEDIAKIIVDMPWATPEGEPRIYNFKDNSGEAYLFSNTFQGTEKTLVFTFTGIKNIQGQDITVEDRQFVRVRKEPRGNLFFPSGYSVVPTSISGQDVRIDAVLSEANASQEEMSLMVYNASGGEVLNLPQGRISTQGEKGFDLKLDLPKGEYTAVLVDGNGKVYGSSYLVVSTVTITYNGPVEKRSVYTFRLTRNDVPVTLSTVRVSVDNGKFGSYEYHNVQEVSIDAERYTGSDPLPSGNHTFAFEIGGLIESVSVDIAAPSIPIFANPLFLGAIIFAGLLVGGGALFSRREQTFYSVDIPDFPPTARERVPLSSDVVLSIFEKMNTAYHWKNTPLRLGEVKNGFKDIYYKGKSIYITDYNSESLLEKMKSKGILKAALGYYAPVSWEKQTGKSLLYLSFMRALRDICINNAIPFTTLGESTAADSEIDVMGQKMFMHFYDRAADPAPLFKRTLATVTQGITIVIFKDDMDKDKFRTLLDSPTTAQLLLKMEVDSSSVLLLTLTELEKMIKELKAV
ncbi:MAG: hypothetical protein V1492_02745 [Candidatus Micrarchaeota archaeon]